MVRPTMRTLGWMTILMLAFAAPALADSHGSNGKGKGQSKSAAPAQSSSSQGTTPGSTGPSAEQRAKMADAHEKMAACLRSSRPINECHAEIAKAHHATGHGCDCAHCEHGEGKCTNEGEGSCERGHHGEGHHGHHGEGHGMGTSKTGTAPATTPTTTPTTGGATQ
ncbi:MAG: hypothetical protein U0900_21170 [Myxococcota bacterium]